MPTNMLRNSVNRIAGCIVLTAGVACSGAPVVAGTPGAAEPIVWKLENTSRIGDHATTVLGAPRVVREGRVSAICFDGATDAIYVSTNPIEGWSQFTVEALIKPDSSGPEEQRFLHIEDERASRLLLETRLTPRGDWALDTFLFTPPESRLTLLDRELLHPSEQWQWVALTFDGKTMTHYVQGKKELEGEIAFKAMTRGRMSLGVRLNQVSWYKGCIREVRFTPAALRERSLHKQARS
jgi:hypothetical protein